MKKRRFSVEQIVGVLKQANMPVSTSTGTKRPSPLPGARQCRRRYLSSAATLSPRPAQNACRVNPLDSYSRASCSNSTRLRRHPRTVTSNPASLMPSEHHKL
jgi:hypothetical protein